MERCTEVAKYKNYLPFAVISAVLPSLMMESVMEGNLVPGSNFIDDMITAQKMQNCEVNDEIEVVFLLKISKERLLGCMVTRALYFQPPHLLA